MWTKLVGAVLKRRSHAIRPVLDAWGCREGWLQAEMFCDLHQREPTFAVNKMPLAERRRADISAAGAHPMVGELKILGGGYQPKCITGGSLKPMLGRTGPIRPRDEKDLCLGPWGLIPDYYRLINAENLDPATQRLLVLVADLRDEDGDLAKVLGDIRFDGEEHRIALGPQLWAKVWRVD